MKSIITIKSLSSEIQHSQEIANKDLVPRCVSEKRQQSLHLIYLSQIFTFWVDQVSPIHSSCWPTRLSHFNIPRTEKYGIAMCYSSTHHVGHAHWERCLLCLRRSLFRTKIDQNILAKKKLRPFLQKFWLKTTATDQTSKLKHKQLHFGHLRVKLPAFTSLAKVSQRIHTISANKINPTPRKHFMISCPTCPPAWSRSWPAPRTASPST